MRPSERATGFSRRAAACALRLAVLLWLAATATTAGEPGPPIDAAHADEPPITPADRDHWSFQPLARPAVPAVEQPEWTRNAIDRFILARLEEAGLAPAPRADRRTLIRRVAFDLIGLPPTRQEIATFLSDDTPGAYESMVDRYLASPGYGERWGQHWLDLARFAETDGFEHDNERPSAWKYRDWVIDAFRRDLPYDQFVRAQIAGDLARPRRASATLATGFALCGPDMPDINSQRERRHMVLNELTATVGSVFLGLHMGCAQCHDHKYDPISQADFYRLRAFFDHVALFRDQPLGDGGEKARVLRERDGERPPSHLMVRGDFDQKGPRVVPAFPRIVNRQGERPSDSVAGRDGEAAAPGLRAELARWLTREDHPLTPRVIVNRVWQHHFSHGLVRTPSDFGTQGDRPSHPELQDWLASELPRLDWSLKRLHRLILGSATYRQASRPHAAEGFASPATRAASTEPPDHWRRGVELDPENRLLWRQNRHRLEAEALRDALLEVSGRLSQRQGGRGVMPPLPEEIRKSIRRDHWKVSPDVEDHYRRSIYLYVRRNLRYPFLAVFDRPDSNTSCARRSCTTIAPQALALLNSQLSLEAARFLAAELLRGGSATVDQRIDDLFERALARLPSDGERRAVRRFLDDRESTWTAAERGAHALDMPAGSNSLGLPPQRVAAWTLLCLAVCNLNEFLYVD